MLQRNASVKKAPQRWHDRDKHYDIVFCFEDRVFNAVIEGLNCDHCGNLHEKI
jgi:hypothetical protein